MIQNTSTTVASDYFPPLPAASQFQFKVFAGRVREIYDSSFAILILSACSLHAWQIIKNPQLLAAPSYREHCSIQAITQQVKEIATKALEEFFECRLILEAMLKQYYEVILNPRLDKSKYLSILKGIGELECNLDLFNYMVKIVPPELTKNMQALVKSGYDASQQLEGLEEPCYRVGKFNLQVIDDLVQAFLQKNNGALSNLVETTFKYKLAAFKELKESIEKYELEHGELQI